MEKLEQESTAKNLTNAQKENIVLQTSKLLAFAEERLGQNESITFLKVSNETHTLTISQK